MRKIMFQRIRKAIWDPSPETELKEIFTRGITRTILPSDADREAINKNELKTADKINCLMLCIRHYHQLPAITYKLAFKAEGTVIDVSSEHTEEHYKLIIALCRRFHIRVISEINDPKLANDPLKMFSDDIIKLIFSYVKFIDRVPLLKDPLYCENVISVTPKNVIAIIREINALDLLPGLLEEITTSVDEAIEKGWSKAAINNVWMKIAQCIGFVGIIMMVLALIILELVTKPQKDAAAAAGDTNRAEYFDELGNDIATSFWCIGGFVGLTLTIGSCCIKDDFDQRSLSGKRYSTATALAVQRILGELGSCKFNPWLEKISSNSQVRNIEDGLKILKESTPEIKARLRASLAELNSTLSTALPQSTEAKSVAIDIQDQEQKLGTTYSSSWSSDNLDLTEPLINSDKVCASSVELRPI
jgi:hypothetical protein